MKPEAVKVIGLGGIGGCLVGVLTRFLVYSYDGEVRMTLIDGDFFEPGNAVRQTFNRLGNKAEIWTETLQTQFPTLDVSADPRFVTADNVIELIRENDTILLCVDNHRTRKLVSDRCGELQNVLLISGGNDVTDGTVQIYWRQGGDHKTPPLDKYHPEIANPVDVGPGDAGCEQQIAGGQAQLVFMNNAVAAWMCNALYVCIQEVLNHSEVYIDMISNKARAVWRE